MVEWPKIPAKIIFDLKTCAPINFAEKCLLKLSLSKETRLPKMPYRSLKSSTSLKYHLYLFTPLPHPPPPPIPNGRTGESLSRLASDCSDWGGGGGDEETNDISG